MKTFSEAIAAGKVSTTEAWEIFDSLDTVDLNFMFGSWQGAGFPTNHPLDGALEAYQWHGKRFDDAEHVHPLVFKTLNGGRASINPAWLMPVVSQLDQLPIPKSEAVGRIFQIGIPLLATHHSGARLRLTTYRGKESATMIYDGLPINDIFRKIDQNKLLGVMDLKGVEQPFFFTLQRETIAA